VAYLQLLDEAAGSDLTQYHYPLATPSLAWQDTSHWTIYMIVSMSLAATFSSLWALFKSSPTSAVRCLWQGYHSFNGFTMCLGVLVLKWLEGVWATSDYVPACVI